MKQISLVATGLEMRPSGLRHTGISTAVNVNDVTQEYGRHNFELFQAAVSELIYLMGRMGKPRGLAQ